MKSPRVHVVLDPEVYDDLRRIARYSDTTMSSLIGSMVAEGAPILHQLADTLEQAHGLSAKLPGAVSAKISTLGREVQDTSDALQEALDDVQGAVADHLEKQDPDAPAPPPGRGGAGASGSRWKPEPPPYINKGVRK